MFRPTRRITIVAIALFIAAGCGSSEDTTTSTDSTTNTATSSTTSTTTSTSASTSSSTTTSTPATASTTSSTVEPTPTLAPTESTVLVYYGTGDGTDCSLVAPHERTVEAGTDPIRGAFDAQVEGPTAEERDADAGSFFSDETVGMIISTELDGGLLIVDFEDRLAAISNAGTSCGSAEFVSELTSTAFQFDEVERVRFALEGSCDEMMSFLQGECFDFVRDGEPIPVPAEQQ